MSGKALREEVVPERGSGELAGTSKVYLDSCNSEFESIKCCSSLSTSVIMHLSMLSRRGGRQGIGRGFDRHSWPVGRAFDRFSCPRGRII